MKLADHVIALCKQHKIRIRPARPNEEGGANRDHIFVHPITSERTYAIALHEIGHVLVGFSKPLLWQEGEAWERAEALALRWTPAMDRARLEGLISYAQFAQERFRGGRAPGVRLPPLGHVFWKYLSAVPEVVEWLSADRASWLYDGTPVIPWGAVLKHPHRPRCDNCDFWKPVTYVEHAETTEKSHLGFCMHKDVPLGVENTPGGALCGSSWQRVVHLPLVPK